MGFFDNPIKAIKGTINRYIPGGKYLTGHAAQRQKFHYNAALDRYNNYANQAQSQINSLVQNLQQSMQNLRSLEEQRYHHSSAGQQLNANVSQYERALVNLERQKSETVSESDSLQKAVSTFKSKAPALAGKISEVEKLPGIFEDLYSAVTRQKEQLAGLSEEEATSYIKKHKADVEALKKQREETENKVRAAMAEFTTEHGNLTEEKANLEQSLERYKYRQGKLLQESNSFQQQRNSLQRHIQDYKNEQDRINSAYNSQEANVRAQESSLQSYLASAQANLDALGGEVQWRADKYKRESGTTGLVQGAALGLATYGIGAGLGNIALESLPWATTKGQILSSLASGLQYAAPVLGIGHYLKYAGRANLRGFERAELGSNIGSGVDLAHIARYGLGSPKVAIPELGGLKQSLSHFDMPIVPQLKDLPQLHEALGKIVSLKDIEGLALGLPSITSASGKKYSTQVLYNPDFIKKLKKVSRRLGTPYFKQNANMTSMGASNIYA